MRKEDGGRIEMDIQDAANAAKNAKIFVKPVFAPNVTKKNIGTRKNVVNARFIQNKVLEKNTMITFVNFVTKSLKTTFAPTAFA